MQIKIQGVENECGCGSGSRAFFCSVKAKMNFMSYFSNTLTNKFILETVKKNLVFFIFKK